MVLFLALLQRSQPGGGALELLNEVGHLRDELGTARGAEGFRLGLEHLGSVDSHGAGHAAEMNLCSAAHGVVPEDQGVIHLGDDHGPPAGDSALGELAHDRGANLVRPRHLLQRVRDDDVGDVDLSESGEARGDRVHAALRSAVAVLGAGIAVLHGVGDHVERPIGFRLDLVAEERRDVRLLEVVLADPLDRAPQGGEGRGDALVRLFAVREGLLDDGGAGDGDGERLADVIGGCGSGTVEIHDR